jgi:anti-anti-sigma factor
MVIPAQKLRRKTPVLLIMPPSYQAKNTNLQCRRQQACFGQQSGTLDVFDLEALEYLSSEGLGVLAHTVKRATAARTEVHPAGATGIVKKVLDITQLSTLMGKS